MALGAAPSPASAPNAPWINVNASPGAASPAAAKSKGDTKAPVDRKAAARFSFLLAIPIIAASGLLKGGELLQDNAQAQWGVLIYAIAVSALVSFSCIHYFLKLIERTGFLPFVIYRVVMGIALLGIHFFVQS